MHIIPERSAWVQVVLGGWGTFKKGWQIKVKSKILIVTKNDWINL